MKRPCPHCGNRDASLIRSNGEPARSLDLTLLCLARVAPADCSFEAEAADVGPDGLVPCGMQWDVNA